MPDTSSTPGKDALETLQAIFAGKLVDTDTEAWIFALPDDASRDRGMNSGADQRRIKTEADVTEFVAKWNGRRNLYFKAARFDLDAPGPRIVNTRVFKVAWLDLDLVPKPNVAPQNLIDMACDAMDKLKYPPSVINATAAACKPFGT